MKWKSLKDDGLPGNEYYDLILYSDVYDTVAVGWWGAEGQGFNVDDQSLFYIIGHISHYCVYDKPNIDG